MAALLSGDRTGVAGAHFVLPAGVGLQRQPLRGSLPLLIGTWGPRLCGMAGAIADEVKVGGSANPAMVPLGAKGGPTPARRRAGRTGSRAGIVIGAVTVVDDDGRLARAQARQEVAMYLDVVGRLDPTVEMPPGLLDELGRVLRASGPGAAAACVPDGILDRFAFAGTPEAVAEHAIDVLAAGADRVEFGTPHGTSADRGLELLGPGAAGHPRGHGRAAGGRRG